MSVCANRPEPVSFFTPCRECACAAAVRDEVDEVDAADDAVVGVRANDNGGAGR